MSVVFWVDQTQMKVEAFVSTDWNLPWSTVILQKHSLGRCLNLSTVSIERDSYERSVHRPTFQCLDA